MRVRGWHVLGVTTGLFLLFFLSSGRVRRHGIELAADGPQIVDWTSWMRWAPRAIREAMDDGATSGGQILAHCMRRLFPEQTWPPESSSSYAERWRELVRGVDRAIRTTVVEDDERQNVIPFRR